MVPAGTARWVTLMTLAISGTMLIVAIIVGYNASIASATANQIAQGQYKLAQEAAAKAAPAGTSPQALADGTIAYDGKVWGLAGTPASSSPLKVVLQPAGKPGTAAKGTNEAPKTKDPSQGVLPAAKPGTAVEGTNQVPEATAQPTYGFSVGTPGTAATGVNEVPQSPGYLFWMVAAVVVFVGLLGTFIWFALSSSSIYVRSSSRIVVESRAQAVGKRGPKSK